MGHLGPDVFLSMTNLKYCDISTYVSWTFKTLIFRIFKILKLLKFLKVFKVSKFPLVSKLGNARRLRFPFLEELTGKTKNFKECLEIFAF